MQQLIKRNILQFTKEGSSIDVRALVFYSYIKFKDTGACYTGFLFEDLWSLHVLNVFGKII